MVKHAQGISEKSYREKGRRSITNGACHEKLVKRNPTEPRGDGAVGAFAILAAVVGARGTRHGRRMTTNAGDDARRSAQRSRRPLPVVAIVAELAGARLVEAVEGKSALLIDPRTLTRTRHQC